MTHRPLWIHRKLSDQIYEQIIADEPKIVVWLIQAPAGMGKTYLARSIGVRLSSTTGYEPAQQGRLLWSGILDLYDPATNSNRGIEQRLVEAFSIRGFEFDEYQAQRELYSSLFKGGISGAGLEEQRRKVEMAFAAGLQEVSKAASPILVFDTTERLELARVLIKAHVTGKELGLSYREALSANSLPLCKIRFGDSLMSSRVRAGGSRLVAVWIAQPVGPAHPPQPLPEFRLRHAVDLAAALPQFGQRVHRGNSRGSLRGCCALCRRWRGTDRRRLRRR